MLNKVFIIEKEQLKQTISNLTNKIEALEAQLGRNSRLRSSATSTPIESVLETSTMSCFPLVPLEIPSRVTPVENIETQTDCDNNPNLLRLQIDSLMRENSELRDYCTQASVKYATWRAESERQMGNKVQKQRLLDKELSKVGDALHTLLALKASQKQCLPVLQEVLTSIECTQAKLATR